jgi:hypothetical protein
LKLCEVERVGGDDRRHLGEPVALRDRHAGNACQRSATSRCSHAAAHHDPQGFEVEVGKALCVQQSR